MYLKTISLYGFKSFVSKTDIEFDKEISAIVGPNGCGKSNIVDAFKWCLGEQSPSSLRVKVMSDLIFNGSETRQPNGFAEVSLTFENSSNVLPINFNEVCITRRIYRSGEVEYYINRVPCRLKDVKDLFANSSIGTEGYSVVEQGRVEFILTSKPEERRVLLEEAAGITRYKLQRDETLRKLELTRANLEKLILVMNEIKREIDFLESQAKKARIYQKYKEELKSLEIAFYTQKILALRREADELIKKMKVVDKEIENINEKIKNINFSIASLKKRSIELESEIINYQQESNNLKIQQARLEEKLKNSNEKINDYLKSKDIAIKKFDSMNSKLRVLRYELETVLNNYKEMDAELNKKRSIVEEKKKVLDSTRDLVLEKQLILSKLNEEIVSIVDRKAHLRNEFNQSNIKLELIQKESLLKQKRIVELRKRRGELQQELVKLEMELLDLKNSVVSDSKKLEELKSKLMYLQKNKKELDEQMKLVEIEGVKTEIDLKRRETIEFITHNFKGIYGPIYKMVNILPGYEAIVKKALFGKEDLFIAESKKDALEVINYLVDKKLGVYGFLILNEIPEIDFKLRPDKLSPLSFFTCNPKFQKAFFYLLYDHYIDEYKNIISDALIFGGEEFIHSKEPEVKEDVIQKRDEIEKMLLEIESDINETFLKLEETNLSLKKSEMLYEATEKDFVKKKMESKEIDDEIEILTSELNKLESQEKATIDSLRNLDDIIKKIDKSEKEKIIFRDKTEQELKKLQNEVQEIEVDYNTIYSDYVIKLERFEFLRKEKERLDSEIFAIEDMLSELKSEIKRLDEKIKIEEESIKHTTPTLKEHMALIEQLEDKINGIKTELSTLYTSIQLNEEELSKYTSQMKTLTQQKYEYELDLKSKNMELENFVSKIKEFNLEIEQAINEYATIETSQEKIERYRKRLASMGELNLSVAEQYDRLNQRYNYLLSQYEDLIKSEEDLKSAMSKINKTIKENFEKTFNQVNQNFKITFAKLFGGGEAKLILLNEENPLESGVDIVVQPPGKRLQSISLLSGGEKSLAAISLLFSLYMTKPSPVCLLDEVDANLDEANIRRFINLLKEFSDKTQFIIITHNKRTIEAVDTIYGITMEESGVSKIITLKLKKENKIA